jgi:hypothetical protein
LTTDTATIESQATALEAEAPPVEPQLIAATDEAPLTPVETETASAPEETETVDPLAEYDPDKVRALPSVKAILDAATKDVEARQAESYRQKAQAAEAEAERKANAAAYARQMEELAAVDNGAAVDALYRALDATIDRGVDPDARERLQAQLPALGEMAKTLTRTTQARIDRTYVDATNQYLSEQYPEYRIAPETVAKFDQALARNDFKGRHAILLDIVKDAAVAAAAPKLRADAIRDMKAEAEKTLKLQKQQADERAASANAGPTAVAGRPAAVGTYRTRLEVATAHANNLITNDQARAYYALPESQLPER